MRAKVSGGACRVLVDQPAAGAWNMAVDEALLLSAAAGGTPVLRFYRWSAPALSLGYFQRLDDRRRHPASAECDAVRRASGGGAIVHDRELTYSLALPATHPLSAGAAALYRAVHGALIDALAACGGSRARLCEATEASRGAAAVSAVPPGGDAFLCFQRRAAGDVLLGEAKIAGSAQRRAPGGLIQHGSILLGRSAAAPELPGWEDLTGHALPAEALAERLLERLVTEWSWSPRPDELSAAERSAAEDFVRRKYGHPDWTARR